MKTEAAADIFRGWCRRGPGIDLLRTESQSYTLERDQRRRRTGSRTRTCRACRRLGRHPGRRAASGGFVRLRGERSRTSVALLHRRSAPSTERVRRIRAESRGAGALGCGRISDNRRRSPSGPVKPRPGLDLYPAGALSVAIGWVLLSLDRWRTANGPAFVPELFVLSVLTGLVGQIEHLAALFVASGVVFGAAMVGVGRQILRPHPGRAGMRLPESSPGQPGRCWRRYGIHSRLWARSRVTWS